MLTARSTSSWLNLHLYVIVLPICALLFLLCFPDSMQKFWWKLIKDCFSRHPRNQPEEPYDPRQAQIQSRTQLPPQSDSDIELASMSSGGSGTRTERGRFSLARLPGRRRRGATPPGHGRARVVVDDFLPTYPAQVHRR